MPSSRGSSDKDRTLVSCLAGGLSLSHRKSPGLPLPRAYCSVIGVLVEQGILLVFVVGVGNQVFIGKGLSVVISGYRFSFTDLL